MSIITGEREIAKSFEVLTNMHIYICICIFVFLCEYLCICTDVHIYVHTYIQLYLTMNFAASAFVYSAYLLGMVSMYVCLYI